MAHENERKTLLSPQRQKLIDFLHLYGGEVSFDIFMQESARGYYENAADIGVKDLDGGTHHFETFASYPLFAELVYRYNGPQNLDNMLRYISYE